MLASVQTAITGQATMIRMNYRLGGWWKLWMVLAVVWTLVSITSGWLSLPRAQHIPHNPRFLDKLSYEAAAIMSGRDVTVTHVRGAPQWSEDPRTIRMMNGTRLTFPATATDERVSLVEGEYRQLLSDEADVQRVPYVLQMLVLWLAPLLVAGLAVHLLLRTEKRATDYSGLCSTANREKTVEGPQSLA
jgi:hypothetical protein